MSRSHHTTALLQPLPMLTPGQLAHELNNLLDGAMRSVNLATRQLTQPDAVDPGLRDAVQRRLETADESMRRMVEIIERYANPTPPAMCCPTDVVQGRGTLLDALTHAVNVYGPAIAQRQIELVTRLDPTLSDLPAGPLYTVLANGLNNALQSLASAELPRAVIDGQQARHRITVRLIRRDDMVVLEIQDTGPGLSDRLFDPVGRFRFGITTKASGHGVGLGVCRQIATDMGGQLQLTNRHEGGAALTLIYPAPDTLDTAEATAAMLREIRRAG